MKKMKLLFIAIIMIACYSLTAQVAVNTDNTDPDASAMLDVKSTSKGFLPPRMTTSQRDVISSPVDGLVIFNTTSNCLEFYAGGFWYITCGSPDIDTVINPTTGKTWMDRNLGASQVATSSTDANAYGGLYQWGRATEGHESRTSITISTNATTPIPNLGNSWDGKFIIEGSSPYDWLTPQDNTLWQGVSGTNNPCPNGFRIATETEWEAERLSWATNDAAGAYGSVLKLTVGGCRLHSGSFLNVGSWGNYWSSTVENFSARQLFIYGSSATMSKEPRANGYSVRCIKD